VGGRYHLWEARGKPRQAPRGSRQVGTGVQGGARRWRVSPRLGRCGRLGWLADVVEHPPQGAACVRKAMMRRSAPQRGQTSGRVRRSSRSSPGRSGPAMHPEVSSEKPLLAQASISRASSGSSRRRKDQGHLRLRQPRDPRHRENWCWNAFGHGLDAPH
jgi:hypothetical protein